MIEELGDEHLGQQPGCRDALVDDVWCHGRLHERLALGARPLAANMALDGEHAGRVVQLLGHVFANALECAATTAGGALGLVVDLAPWQVGGQLLALGLLLVLRRLLLAAQALEFLGQRCQVGVDGLLDQAILLGVEGFALGRELQPLEHGHLVGELVDDGLLERRLALVAFDELVLDRHLGHQPQQCLAHLLRIELVEVLWGDHGR